MPDVSSPRRPQAALDGLRHAMGRTDGDEVATPGVLLSVVPFAAVAVVGQLVAIWNPSPVNASDLVASGALLCLSLAGLAVREVRRASWGPSAILLSYVASVTMLQLAEGGSSTGSGVLLLLPLVASALFFRWVETAFVAVAALVSIAWVSTASDSPPDLFVRRMVLWSAICVLTTIPIHALRAHLRASILEARTRLHQAQSLEAAARELATLRNEQDIVRAAERLGTLVASPPGGPAFHVRYQRTPTAADVEDEDTPDEVRVTVRPEGRPHGALVVAPAVGLSQERQDGLAALGRLVELSLSSVFAHRRLEDQAMHEERRRIARELHDGLAHELAFIAARTRSNAQRTAQGDAAALARSADRALDEARRAITVLSAREPLRLSESIAQTAEDLAARYGLRIELDLAADVHVEGEPGEHLLRIVREAICNAARHGHPRSLRIRLWDDGARHLVIEDDGVGFDPDAPSAGFGLTSMRERAAAVGGRLSLSSAPAAGTRVEVLVP